MTDDDYAEAEARRLRSITAAVADLVRGVAEKSEIYGLNGEELGAINPPPKASGRTSPNPPGRDF